MTEVIKKVEFKNNAVLKSVSYTTYSDDDAKLLSNGAPCVLKFEPKIHDTQLSSHWEAVKNVRDMLNLTPDNLEKNHSEIDWRFTGTPVYNKSDCVDHGYAGDGMNAYIDRISADTIQNVAAKALRKLHEDGVITKDELNQAYGELDLPRGTLSFVASKPGARSHGSTSN